MKKSLNIVLANLVILSLFSSCASKSPKVEQVMCTKENINECRQEDKLFTIKHKPELIEYLKKPNQELQLSAVEQDPKLIRFIKKPNKEVQITALKQDPAVIEFIENPSVEALIY